MSRKYQRQLEDAPYTTSAPAMVNCKSDAIAWGRTMGALKLGLKEIKEEVEPEYQEIARQAYFSRYTELYGVPF